MCLLLRSYQLSDSKKKLSGTCVTSKNRKTSCLIHPRTNQLQGFSKRQTACEIKVRCTRTDLLAGRSNICNSNKRTWAYKDTSTSRQQLLCKTSRQSHRRRSQCHQNLRKVSILKIHRVLALLRRKKRVTCRAAYSTAVLRVTRLVCEASYLLYQGLKIFTSRITMN